MGVLRVGGGPQVIQECETQLVVVHKERFHTECRRMIEDRLLDDLARTYNLLSRTAKGLDPMLESFKEAIESVGTTAIQLLGDSIIKVRRRGPVSLC